MVTAYKIGIIVPVFNEKIEVVKSVLNGIPNTYFIYLINDGCDINYSILSNEQIQCFKLEENEGQGAALNYGIVKAIEDKCDYFITMDSDGQHDSNQIQNLLQPVLKSDADIVLGSRFLGKSTIPKIKKILLNGGIWINYLFFGIKLTDAHNGFRCFNLKVAQKIQFKLKRMAHASEILDIIKRNKFICQEVPVTLLYNDYSKAKGQKISNSIFILGQLLYYKLIVKK